RFSNRAQCPRAGLCDVRVLSIENMPNLVGMWSPALTADAIGSVLKRQLDRVRIEHGTYVDHQAAFDGFGMALQDHGLLENGAQPAMDEMSRTALMLDGELTYGAELRQQFSTDLPRGPLATSELCLCLILRHRTSVCRLYNGFFCIVLYDAIARRLTLVSDRYGARPLYYVRRPTAFLFGSELKALAVADPS